MVLCPGAGLGVPTPCPGGSWPLFPLLCAGLWALRLWGALRLGAVVLRWRYRGLRGELYRPAWEPQDHEMVELLLRRLRLWLGFSKAKEVGTAQWGWRRPAPGTRSAAGVTEPLCRPQFRHKVRFEGMEPLPSRSSRGSKASDARLPSAGSDASHPSTSSSQLDGPGPGHPGARGEPEPSRLHAVFEALLAQFDRLNQATEEVYQLEWRLQSLLPASDPRPAQAGTDAAPGPTRTSARGKNRVHPSST